MTCSINVLLYCQAPSSRAFDSLFFEALFLRMKVSLPSHLIGVAARFPLTFDAYQSTIYGVGPAPRRYRFFCRYYQLIFTFFFFCPCRYKGQVDPPLSVKLFCIFPGPPCPEEMILLFFIEKQADF